MTLRELKRAKGPPKASGMRVLSLCTGIGGDAAALEMAGVPHTMVAMAERDRIASAVLAHKFPDVPNIGDINHFKDFASFHGQIDLITAGLPCQPHSIAGKGKRLGDARDLTRRFLHIVEAVQPGSVLVENVPHYKTGARGGGFGVLSRGLHAAGYAVDALVIDAAGFVPQRRKRLWILAHRGGAGIAPSEILADAARGGRGSDAGDPARIQTRAGTAGSASVLHPPRLGTLMASAAGLNRPGMRGHELSFLVVQDVPGHGLVVRRPTPLEALRAQGFRDDWLDCVEIDDRTLRDLERYQLIGNSWPVPVAAAILRQLNAAFSDETNSALAA